ncbi:MAG: uracil phosphoribosyltransferase [Acidobacteriota bacterium]
MDTVTVVNHPLVQHKLTLLRDKNTSTAVFRSLARELSMLLAYEVTRDLPVTKVTIETPVAPMVGTRLDGKELVLVGILRAGLGLVDGMLHIVPSAVVGHIGLRRNEETLEPESYYLNLPPAIDQREVVVLDPMLATAGTAIYALDQLKQHGARSLRFVCLLAAPEGIERFHQHHPDVPVVTGAIDEKLNEKGYIVPGLGDAGDRLYGTL